MKILVDRRHPNANHAQMSLTSSLLVVLKIISVQHLTCTSDKSLYMWQKFVHGSYQKKEKSKIKHENRNWFFWISILSLISEILNKSIELKKYFGAYTTSNLTVHILGFSYSVIFKSNSIKALILVSQKDGFSFLMENEFLKCVFYLPVWLVP